MFCLRSITPRRPVFSLPVAGVISLVNVSSTLTSLCARSRAYEWQGGYTSLYFAAQGGHTELVLFLIGRRANVESATDVSTRGRLLVHFRFRWPTGWLILGRGVGFW